MALRSEEEWANRGEDHGPPGQGFNAQNSAAGIFMRARELCVRPRSLPSRFTPRSHNYGRVPRRQLRERAGRAQTRMAMPKVKGNELPAVPVAVAMEAAALQSRVPVSAA